MQLQINKNPVKLVTRKDSVILHFDEVDSQIARNWSESKSKDVFDDKN